MLKKLACFTGWLLVLSLSLLFCFTLGLWQSWSTPIILLFWLLMLILATLLWVVIYAMTKVIKRKQGSRWLEKYRLSRREYLLLNHWKRGAGIIKRIHRRRAPLPWYLLVGERCGKSTLLAGAELPRFDGDHDDAVVGPTRTLRWWFFRHLCVLDLSANFLNGGATFRQAWGKLARWCTQMPAPSGIIIAIPVSVLLRGDLNALHALARQQRALIEPLIHRFGECLPLHIMVTQCDLFPGFSLWSQQLSATQRQQPLGYSWQTSPHIDGQDELTLQPLFAALKQGMSRARLSMARPENLNEHEHATLLDFPEIFTSLEPKLRYALASLCEPNAYFSSPRLHSVWFSAAEPLDENRGRRVSVFIHEMLTCHLRNFSQFRPGLLWYQRQRGKSACIAVLLITALWIAISAGLSFNRLQPEITHLSPDALAVFLSQDEQSPTTLNYLPFQILLQKQRKQAELQLANVPSTPRQATATLADFQHQVLTASAKQQRELILQLTHAILIWKEMRDGVSLEEISHSVPLATPLLQRTYPSSLSPLTTLALERYYMLTPEGEDWFQRARQLLVNLVNHDQNLSWLMTPWDTLPDLPATAYWPTQPKTVILSGIWTSAGNSALNKLMTQIEQAAGKPLPVFQLLRDNEYELRQNAWRKYIIDVTANLSSSKPATMSRTQLIAIEQNQSQAMQLVVRILNELSDIPTAQAQPWLITLRRLQQLKSNEPLSSLMGRATHIDNQVRQSLITWLHGTPSDLQWDNATTIGQAWQQWQTARNSAIKEAVAQGDPDPKLTRGLFNNGQNSSDHNPLAALFPALNTLQENISPQNSDAGVAAVWLLYKEDARRLLGNAMAQSACWLNNQWKSTVIWPLDKGSEPNNYDNQQIHSLQLASTFLRGPGRMLITTNTTGPVAASFAGMQVPVNTGFIRLVQQSFSPEILQDVPQQASTREKDLRAFLQVKVDDLMSKQQEQEKGSWKLSVASLPASVPGGARVIPTGIRLTLNCLNGDQQLTSMNFAEKRDFSWQPGQCPGVILDVIFPDFITSYQLHGDDAWPSFINSLNNGELLLDDADFGDSAELLQQLGIKHILARFTISSAQEMETAWQTWSDLNTSINSLKDRIASIDEQIQPLPINPIAALPVDIAQCR